LVPGRIRGCSSISSRFSASRAGHTAWRTSSSSASGAGWRGTFPAREKRVPVPPSPPPYRPAFQAWERTRPAPSRTGHRGEVAPSDRIRPFPGADGPGRHRSSPGALLEGDHHAVPKENETCSAGSGWRISRSTTRRCSSYHSTFGRCGTFSTSSSARVWNPNRSRSRGRRQGRTALYVDPEHPSFRGDSEETSEGETVRSSHRFASYRKDVIRTGRVPRLGMRREGPGWVPGGWYRFLRFLVSVSSRSRPAI